MEELELLIAYVLFYGALEMLYLKFMAPIYQRNFEVVQGSGRNPNIQQRPYTHLGWAVVAYIALFISVYRFVVRPIFIASTKRMMPTLYANAANATLLAIAIYGVYNLTNLATLRGYSPSIAALDTAWGITAINVVAGACYALKIWVTER